MFGLSRRMFSTTARVANQIAQSPAHVTPDVLPPVLVRLIQRSIAGREDAKSIDLPNPFLPSKPNGSWCPAWIPRRRQKQLLQLYPAHLLPPSPINPVEPVPVQWPSGTVINWVGEYKPKEYKSIYANRRQLFKGHKRERERAERKAEVDGRLETMDARIAEWKAEVAENKANSRSTLPF
ncbi:hypothetical protein A1Q1_05091 [Trichosporon asahii var. asahii CBS 2479]|uniref:Large ribosomal subunit protein mL59 domain-containing protein n=1 Tax=Trichosporon asahii var. asahii (strain ATCC 90039 / CBS 2479 / JCM 2466 / KCTC 7840 / NBRC 103889/ NCYC 2677 / UAMH 7654) TaxID=1186058 RepID=J6EU06_TRIAS|nr:hypothetical protein A1Q1_05091 [Trichosporon asahii var. asahii CBS 2479]EJT46262.1 hypothetical protein A1Q1_05091 [Trichosporon asahii var. asahii CBS 2479]